MDDDGLPHLRNSLRRGPALRVAPVAQPAPRLVEGPQHYYAAQPPAPQGLTFWQYTLRAVPIVIAIVSTGALAYFLLSDRSEPFAQLQERDEDRAATEVEQAEPPEALQPQRAETEAPPQQEAQAEQPPPPPPQVLPPEQRPAVPSDDKLIMLINSSLLALNHANMTGNYTVLRDLAAPGFQHANSPEKLARVFTDLRNRNLDLTPILLFQPKLYQRPIVNDRGMLRITGYFPTSPERINFDLIFQPVQGKWRLYGIAAKTQRLQAPPAGAAPAPQGAAAPAAAPAKPAEAEAVKPAAPAKKAAAKPKPPAAEAEATAPADVRDRIDNPPPASAAAAKPEKKGIWNPFGR